MSFEIQDRLIPVTSGQAVGAGWTRWTGGKPMGVTWHWTAGHDLAACTKLLGGVNPERKNVASAHYGVGRSYEEGVHRYVSIENRSWHAGKQQILRWDGQFSNEHTKGARSTIGIETVSLGFARDGIEAHSDWIEVADTNCKWTMRVQPWTDEQLDMMISIGKLIVERWPHIGVRDHHGHHDLCPGYKSDVGGLDFQRLLSGIYPNESVPDAWKRFSSVRQRQQALIDLGYDLGEWGADSNWGDYSALALSQFHSDSGLADSGFWTTFTGWAVCDRLDKNG